MQILYPVNILTCKLMDTNNNNIINVFGPLDITTDWGIPFYITNGFVNETIKLDSIWYSEIDTKFYYANATLNFPDKITELVISQMDLLSFGELLKIKHIYYISILQMK
mgnify:CR=1 FL=1